MADSPLLRALVHQLRNSIAPVVNASHLLRLRIGDDPTLAGVLSIIDRQVGAIARTLDAVAEAGQLARGDVALARRRVDLASVIDDALADARPTIEARNQKLEIAQPRETLCLDADPGRIAAALASVLDNAARYTPEGGRIGLDVSRSGGNVEIRVTDNGRGIAPDALPHLFDEAAASCRSSEGLGLGLTLAQGFCALHGGRIDAASEGEGRGSCFTITLPLDEPAVAVSPAPDAAAEGDAPTRRRILVADDNRAVRDLLAAVLREEGHDVRTAADGAQAFDVAAQWSPDFVLLDVQMPKANGYAIARRLRVRFPSHAMRLVMMSGAGIDQTALAGAKESGFDYCIDKTLGLRAIEPLLRGEARSLQDDDDLIPPGKTSPPAGLAGRL
jgi:CheY-like chemotaxis protein/anti-sigma regulatory factor (Ser/Thr protein kinase)